MKKNLLTLILSVMTFWGGYSYCFAAIKAPEAPPDLPDTLRDFRTAEQMREFEELKSADGTHDDIEDLEIQEAPFVPGDDGAGVARFANVYVPGLVTGVPARGALIMRFFDAEGIPWEIDGAQCEHQGFIADVTASPSELLVRQESGAATTALKVTLRALPDPLIFTLRPVRLERNGVPVTSLIETVKLKQSQNGVHYVKPEPEQFAVPNPKASALRFDGIDAQGVEDTLLNAVRSLK